MLMGSGSMSIGKVPTKNLGHASCVFFSYCGYSGEANIYPPPSPRGSNVTTEGPPA